MLIFQELFSFLIWSFGVKQQILEMQDSLTNFLGEFELILGVLV